MVEDDPQTVRDALSIEGCRARGRRRASELARIIRAERPRLVLPAPPTTLVEPLSPTELSARRRERPAPVALGDWQSTTSARTNVVRILVRKLRRKRGEDAAPPAWIFNEREVGYRMPDPNDR